MARPRINAKGAAAAVSVIAAAVDAVPAEQRDRAVSALKDAAGKVTVPARLSASERIADELDAIADALGRLDEDPERAVSTAAWWRRLRALRSGLPLAEVARSRRKQLRELSSRAHELQAEVFAAAITPDVVVSSQVRRLEDPDAVVDADGDADEESPRD